MTRRTLFPALLLTLGACASGATNGATNGATRRVAAAPSFSAGNDAAMIARDIGYLADPRLEGRGTGTAGNDSAAAYLVRRYAELGLTGTLQKFVAKEPVRGGEPRALPTQNVYSVVPGRDASLRAEYVIIGAHFDHLGRSSTGALDPEAGNIIHPGADDNASGTAAVLALAQLNRDAEKAGVKATRGMIGDSYAILRHADTVLLFSRPLPGADTSGAPALSIQKAREGRTQFFDMAWDPARETYQMGKK